MSRLPSAIRRDGRARPRDHAFVARAARAGTQSANLGCLERARPTGPQAVDPDRPDPDADESLDRRADRREHPPQLALPALPQRRPIPRQLARGRIQEADELVDLDLGHRPEVEERRGPLVEGDPRGREVLGLVGGLLQGGERPLIVQGAAKEGFVPKIRVSSVVRFLEYLRKTRGRGVVAEAIASWSVDADKLTEDTWLSVEACAQLLEIVETKFGDGSYGYIRKLFSGAMSTFPTVLEQLSKAIPLTALAERAPIVYAKEWNYGRLEVTAERRKIVFRHYDWMPTPAMCAMFHGIYEGGLIYRGVKGKVTKTMCVRTGSDHCEYRVEW